MMKLYIEISVKVSDRRKLDVVVIEENIVTFAGILARNYIEASACSNQQLNR